jgi:tRNA synthetases class I (W and Y)
MATMTDALLLDDLIARGLVQECTDQAGLAARLAEGPITVYNGCDPTADSLHVGNLLGLLVLRRFQEAGHRPLALVGGATGMIGDPSGRSEERNLLDEATLAHNVGAIKAQIERILDLSGGPTGGALVDNRDWTGGVSYLDFLRDVGKHVTVGTMLARESVKNRMASEHGISYTEFSYMLIQCWKNWYGLVRSASSQIRAPVVLPSLVPSAAVRRGQAKAQAGRRRTRRIRSMPPIMFPSWSDPPTWSWQPKDCSNCRKSLAWMSM